VGVGTGRNELAIAIPQALPKPPDITTLGEVPGGLLIACTPNEPPPGGTTKRTNYALKFEGIRAQIRRLAILLPVFVGEQVLQKQTVTTETRTIYGTEEEAIKAYNFVGGAPLLDKTQVPIAPDQAFESEVNKFAYFRELEVVEAQGKKETERSVLPITVQVVVRINGPEGTIFSESFDVPVRYVFGPAGKGAGAGLLEKYVDLVNPLAIDCDFTYGLELLVFIPASVVTNTQLGVTLNKEAAVQGTGGVSFYYDLETGPPSK
jgi:hypothetical protein